MMPVSSRKRANQVPAERDPGPLGLLPPRRSGSPASDGRLEASGAGTERRLPTGAGAYAARPPAGPAAPARPALCGGSDELRPRREAGAASTGAWDGRAEGCPERRLRGASPLFAASSGRKLSRPRADAGPSAPSAGSREMRRFGSDAELMQASLSPPHPRSGSALAQAAPAPPRAPCLHRQRRA